MKRTFSAMLIIFGILAFFPSGIKALTNDVDIAWLHYLLPFILLAELPFRFTPYSFVKILFYSIFLAILIEVASFIGFVFLPKLLFGKLLINVSVSYWCFHFCLLVTILLVFSLLIKRKQLKMREIG